MTSLVILPLGLMALGVVVGPLLGVIVDRMTDRSPLEPEHRCTVCLAGFGSSSLVPVASWSASCAECGTRKSRRYQIVDLATATVFALLGLRFGIGWMLVPYLALGAVLVVLSVIDAETHLLPNTIVWPSFLGGLFVIFVISGQRDYANGIYSALVGAAVFAGFIGAAHVLYERGMGRGDVKLSLTLGLFLGWLQPNLINTTRLVLITIFVALLGGAIGGTVYNLAKSRGRAEIPFGPALAVATLCSVLVSSSVLDTVTL